MVVSLHCHTHSMRASRLHACACALCMHPCAPLICPCVGACVRMPAHYSACCHPPTPLTDPGR